MYAKIYQPAQSAMQSGQATSQKWTVEFSKAGNHTLDPLTGTYRSTDVMDQIELQFDTLDEALSYVQARNIPHQVIKPRTVKSQHRSYAENFAYDRKLPWTH